MSYRLRKLVFWLLLIALPLQGFAAVTGAACTCMHAQMMTMDAPSASMSAHGHADEVANANVAGNDGDAPCHNPPVKDAQHCTAHADDGAGGNSDPSGQSCKACSGCCVVHAALPVVVIVAQDEHLPRTLAEPLPDLFKDHVALTPKRPPRPLSA